MLHLLPGHRMMGSATVCGPCRGVPSIGQVVGADQEPLLIQQPCRQAALSSPEAASAISSVAVTSSAFMVVAVPGDDVTGEVVKQLFEANHPQPMTFRYAEIVARVDLVLLSHPFANFLQLFTMMKAGLVIKIGGLEELIYRRLRAKQPSASVKCTANSAAIMRVQIERVGSANVVGNAIPDAI